MDMARPPNARGKPRDKGAVLPRWFLEKVREIADERKQSLGESLGDLAQRLTEAIGRTNAWGHSDVSRFLSEKVVTAPMAEAFADPAAALHAAILR